MTQPHNSSARAVAFAGVYAALALVFSYVEVLIPFHIGIPGVKLGLANLVVILAMYRMNNKMAVLVNVIRMVLAAAMFSGMYGLMYSLAGATLSMAVMMLLKKTGKFSISGVSIAGGITHNIGQLIVAMLVVENLKLAYYIPVLMISGLVTGLLIGFAADLLNQRLKKLNRI